MKIAIAVDKNEHVSDNIKATTSFRIINTQEKNEDQRVSILNLTNPPKDLIAFLKEHNVQNILANSYPAGLMQQLAEAQINPVFGISGPLEETINDILEGLSIPASSDKSKNITIFRSEN